VGTPQYRLQSSCDRIASSSPTTRVHLGGSCGKREALSGFLPRSGHVSVAPAHAAQERLRRTGHGEPASSRARTTRSGAARCSLPPCRARRMPLVSVASHPATRSGRAGGATPSGSWDRGPARLPWVAGSRSIGPRCIWETPAGLP
jgi:hypothetical protein